MPTPFVHRPQQLALAIALSLGCIELSMAQVETNTATGTPDTKDVAAPWLKRDDLLAIKNFIGPKRNAVKPPPAAGAGAPALIPVIPAHRAPMDVAIDMSEYAFPGEETEKANAPGAPWPESDDLLAIGDFIGPKTDAAKQVPLTPEKPLEPVPSQGKPKEVVIDISAYELPEAAPTGRTEYDEFRLKYFPEYTEVNRHYKGVDGVALSLSEGNDVLIVNKGASFGGEIQGGGGQNVLVLDSEDGGPLGKTSNFMGLHVKKGSWSLTGQGDFSEGAEVMGGATLFNMGSIAGDAIVYEGGTYGGHGEIRNLVVEGTLLVNESLGAPHIRENLVLEKSATLLYGLTVEGKPPTIVVDGTAVLSGNPVRVVATSGNYADINEYTVLRAAKLEGTFGPVTTNLAYMKPELSQSETEVKLHYSRNELPIEKFAANDNSRSFGQSAEKPTVTANAAINALLGSSEKTAYIALDQLTGYDTANLAKLTLNSDAPVSASLLSAMRQLDGTYGNNARGNNSPRLAAGSEDHGRVWIQGLGHSGKLDRDFGALQHSTTGLLIGADWAVDDEWRLGLMGGKSTTRVDGILLDGALDSWHLGAYAARLSGPVALRLGATHNSHDGSTKRQIGFNGFIDRPKGQYDANTQHVFAELGYNLGRDNYRIEPFANLGYQRYQRGNYTEKGWDASLQVEGQTRSNINSTFGLRVAKVNTLNNGMKLSPRFSAGWKHTYGEVVSESRQKLANGGSRFTVEGAALDRNSVILDAGLDLSLSARHTLGVGLNGEMGTDSRNHGITGQWRMTFLPSKTWSKKKGSTCPPEV